MIDFALPEELIAQEPARPRDSARLLVYERKSKTIIDSVFSELPKYLAKDTTLVVNNSKVEHCRWLFDDGRTEVFVLEKLDTQTVRALIRPGKKFKVGTTLHINDWLSIETLNIDIDGIRTLRLSIPHDDSRLTALAHVPLPPYIAQDDSLASEYQTIYAKPLGSKAAPTAGLHFTGNLMQQIRADHDIQEVTLHVGLGTFASLQQENYDTGTLHSEHYEVSQSAANALERAVHITAVGTTSTRTLESAGIRPDGNRAVLCGDTNIFIQPGYTFTQVDSIITNFHLPGTSLLLMIEAFVGSESEMLRIYNHAIKEKYRFYSFGDGMLIL